MNVIKFKLGRNYTAEFSGIEETATCIEIKESYYAGKEVVFEIGYKYYRCDIYDTYDSLTYQYCEQADFGPELTILASRERY